MLNPLRSSMGSRVALAVLASSVLLVASAGVVAAGANDGAVRVSPDPTVRDLHVQSWDHITVAGNGKRLVVYFWMGPQACNGLGRVNVARHDGQVHIRLWDGILPAAYAWHALPGIRAAI